MSAMVRNGVTTGANIFFELDRNSTPLFTGAGVFCFANYSDQYLTCFSACYKDTPSAGTVTYYLKSKYGSGGSTSLYVGQRSLVALEVKK